MASTHPRPPGFVDPAWVVKPAEFHEIRGQVVPMYSVASFAAAIGRHPSWIRERERNGTLPPAIRWRNRRTGRSRRMYSYDLIVEARRRAAYYGVLDGHHAPDDFLRWLRAACAKYGRNCSANAPARA